MKEPKMKFISKNKMELNRELSELDLFALNFIKILRKYSEYVIVSGYVSILLGRSRASEDVDVIIPKMELSDFRLLLKELKNNDFYCLNSENDKEIYDYIENNAARFAKNSTVIPNIELKFSKHSFDALALKNKINVKVRNEELVISHLEMQIAFKEVVLKSEKDMEDARHLRTIAKGYLDLTLIKKYEKMLHEI